MPLIEKAYAKLHGCYESLISGFIDDGLTDMTGLAAEKVKIQDGKGQLHKDIQTMGVDQFFDQLIA